MSKTKHPVTPALIGDKDACAEEVKKRLAETLRQEDVALNTVFSALRDLNGERAREHGIEALGARWRVERLNKFIGKVSRRDFAYEEDAFRGYCEAIHGTEGRDAWVNEMLNQFRCLLAIDRNGHIDVPDQCVEAVDVLKEITWQTQDKGPAHCASCGARWTPENRHETSCRLAKVLRAQERRGNFEQLEAVPYPLEFRWGQ